MYNIGEYIVYGTEGVCRVEAVGTMKSEWANCEKTYYTLAPVYHRGVIYAPTDVTIHMRAIMTAEEARKLISRMPDIKDTIQQNMDCRKLSQEYQMYLNTGNCMDLVQLIHLLYVKGERIASMGKTARQIDDRYFKKAKELLYGELALSMDIPYADVEKTVVDLVRQEKATRQNAY